MRKSYCGFRFVYMLSAGSAALAAFDFYIGRVDVDLDLLDLGQYSHRDR